jgi:ABC-type nitrate/sulfonate/bicarbonate transport system permease component
VNASSTTPAAAGSTPAALAAVEQAEQLAPRARRARRIRRQLSHVWPPALVLLAVVILWEALTSAFAVSSSVLPGPALVIEQSWADRANLWPAMWTTTKEAVLGIVLATIVAVVLAVAIDWSRTVRRSLYPLLVTSQTLPIIVLAPLVVIWFGFGIAPKVGLVALFTFFPIAVGAVQGLASADPDAMALLRTMGASRRQLLLRVRAPSAVPQLFTGLKVAVTYAYVSAIFAEYVGAEQGLGVYMQASKNAFRTELVFGAILVTTVLTLALFLAVVLLERLAMPWRRPPQSEVGW